MRVLITGSGPFRDALVDRLKREKNDVYTIGNDSPENKTFHYDFKYTDDMVQHVIAGIMPEVIVFMGAFDEQYAAEWGQKQAMDYLSGLSNILLSAEQIGTSHFVYLSSTQVYGMELGSRLSEETKVNPQDVRSILISQGETFCQTFSAANKIEAVILRMTEVYGLASSYDFCSRLFLEASLTKDLKNFFPAVDMLFNPVYLSDAVDAVYKAVVAHKDGGVFNVTGGKLFLSQFYKTIAKLVSEKSLEEEALSMIEGPEIFVPGEDGDSPAEDGNGSDNEAEKEAYSLEELLNPEDDLEPGYNTIIVERTCDGSAFSAAYGYRPIVDYHLGLKRTYFNMRKRLEKGRHRDKKEKKGLKMFAPILPYLECVLAFAAFAFLHYFIPEWIPSFAGFDFIILMVVVIAITLGGIQPILAVFMAGALLIGLRMQGGDSFVKVLLDMGVVLRILNLLVVGTICGYARDHMRTTMHERKLEVEDLSNELLAIYRINAANTEIKKTLDERLTSYDDSLAKMFVITDKLNAMNPESVFFEAVEVVADIMQSFDVSIYIVTGDDFKMCRLHARTPSSERSYRVSIPLNELGELAEVVGNDEIFVNRDLQDQLPMMAAPVFSGRELQSIIMLWDVPIQKLTLYQVNRFMTMSRLIAASLGRAHTIAQGMHELSYIPGTDILMFDAFMDKVKIFKDALEKEAADFMVIVVSPAKNRRSLSNAELASSLRPILRTNDYLGEMKEDPDSLYVLLSNTTHQNVGIVFERLGGVGLVGREISL